MSTTDTQSHERPVLSWGAATDTGRVRESNEDSYVAQPLVFAVADGMGGHQAGEVASAIAASVLNERLGNGALSTDLVVAAVTEANAAIFHGAHSNPSQRGMGTTLTALVVMTTHEGEQRLVVANVGDSRTYLLRDGVLRRVTIDHSYVQELVSTGHITEAEARNHPRRNIVTRALGIEPTVRVDTEVLPLVRGDRYVLCSDGLVDEADDTDIAAVLATYPQPQACAQALVQLANDKGGRDNTTVVVVDVLAGTDHAPDSDAVLEAVADVSGEIVLDAEHPSTEESAAESTSTEPVADTASTEPHTPTGVAVPAARRMSARMRATLFGLGLAAVVVVTVIVLAVASNSSPTAPTTTTTTSTSTTVSASSTSTTTSTVVVTST